MRTAGIAREALKVAAVVSSLVCISAQAQAAPGDFRWWKESDLQNIGSSPAVGPLNALYVGSADGTIKSLQYVSLVENWSISTGGSIGSTPALAPDGTVVVGSFDGYVYAIDDSAGAVKWRFQTGGPIYSSPAIGADGTVYIGSSDATIYALDSEDGSVIWSHTTGGEIGSSPAIAPDGSVYAGSADGKLYAFDPAGNFIWDYATGGGVISPAIGAGARIYAGSFDGWVYALNPDGSLQWSYDTGSRVAAAPAVAPDGTVYVGTYDTELLVALSFEGDLLWSEDAGGRMFASPSVGADGQIYTVSVIPGQVRAFSPSGTLSWGPHASSESIYAAPALIATTGGSPGALIAVNKDGRFFELEATSPGLADSTWPMFGQGLHHQRRSLDADADSDGILDSWEVVYASEGLDPAVAGDAGLDPDRDRRTNQEEFENGTNPGVPNDPNTREELVLLAGDIAPLGSPDGVVDIADASVAFHLLANPTATSSLDELGQILTDLNSDANGNGVFELNDSLIVLNQLTAPAP